MTPEEAVRNYLTFLRTPEKLRDDAAIKKLSGQVEKASDPLEEARARTALRSAEGVDEEQYRSRFVELAKDWAEAEGVPASVLAEMGVPNDALSEAGFDVGRRGGRRRGGSGRRASSGRGRVRAEDVRDAALSADGPFSAADLRDRSGGSPGTVRKVLTEMRQAGEITEIGPDPDWSSRGRPPTRYQS